jgi:glyoxylase-like metal-dependent hydrolase (beta-lactamase superfamily II)
MQGPEEIVPGVYGLGSELVNWYLIEQDGRLTAVDAGLPAFADTLESDLARIGHSLGDLDAIVLTHSDADHIGSVPSLRADGARVLIHEQDQATLRKPGAKGGDASPIHLLPFLVRPAFWRLIAHMARRGGAKAPAIEGAESFRHGDVLDVPGSPRVIHTPGHTAGHCALLFTGHNALLVGDAMCTWNPLTGHSGAQLMPSAFNVSTKTCLESLAALDDVHADVLLPGHGEPWRGGVAEALELARRLAG